jgi:hypothetical protein
VAASSALHVGDSHVSLDFTVAQQNLYSCYKFIIGIGLSSCKECWNDGSASYQRLRGKRTKLECARYEMFHRCYRKLFKKKRLLCAP